MNEALLLYTHYVTSIYPKYVTLKGWGPILGRKKSSQDYQDHTRA